MRIKLNKLSFALIDLDRVSGELNGVAESRYEPRTEFFEGSLRISQNHSAIQQRQLNINVLPFYSKTALSNQQQIY